MRVGTTKEVMGLLRCSDDYVYELAAKGGIPVLRRVGGQLRFDMDAVEAWFRGDSQGGDA